MAAAGDSIAAVFGAGVVVVAFGGRSCRAHTGLTAFFPVAQVIIRTGAGVGYRLVYAALLGVTSVCGTGIVVAAVGGFGGDTFGQ